MFAFQNSTLLGALGGLGGKKNLALGSMKPPQGQTSTRLLRPKLTSIGDTTSWRCSRMMRTF